jgi:hypothetical protein
MAAGGVEAREGVVRTLDGQRWSGEVQFTNDAILVGGTQRVALVNLQRLGPEAPGVSAAAAGRGRGLGALGYYYARPGFQGSPVPRLDETLDFDWGEGEPGPDLPRDGFGVVWLAEIEAPVAGEYVFYLQADESARLQLGGQAAVEVTAASPEAAIAPVALQAGQRLPLRVEFNDRVGPARIRLSWSGPGWARTVVPRERLHPVGGLPNHSVLVGGEGRGLLGVYYDSPGFAGRTVTRLDGTVDANWSDADPAPGISRGSFSVRWTGQVLADHNEPYTFSVVADEPARLWLDGRLLLAVGGDNFFFERRETVALAAGERHDLRLETHSTSGGATIRLNWSSPSTPKAPIPSTHLFPSRSSSRSGAPRADQTPPGVLLRNGVFLAGSIEGASETAVRLGGRWRGRTVSLVNVARILCQPIGTNLAPRLEGARTGLVLNRGDFVEGEFRGLDQGQVTLRSILFGAQAYDTQKEAAAVLLRPPSPRPGPYEIRLSDRSILGAASLGSDTTHLLIRDAVLGVLKIPVGEVEVIQRGR